MTIRESHYQFKLNKDRIDSLAKQDFNSAEIDWLINEATNVFVKQRFNGLSNNKRAGFENTQKRIDDLSTLVVKYPNQPALTPTLLDGVYEIDLADLAYTYLFYISGSVDITKDGCTNSTYLKFVQHDDYKVSLRDPFNSPSLEFIPFNFGRSSTGLNSSIYIYPGDYTLDNVKIEYLRHPNKASLGNYTYIDGITYPVTDIDLPEHTHSEVIDIACQIAAMNIESPEYIQLKNSKVFIHE